MATIAIKKPKPSVKLPAATDPFTPEIQLSARDSQIILAALENPPKPNAKLMRAAARFNRMATKKL